MKRIRFADLRNYIPFTLQNSSLPFVPPFAQSLADSAGAPQRPLFGRRSLGVKEFAARNFGLGYELDQKGRREEASWVYRATIETLERWSQCQAKDAPPALLSAVALRHGARLMRLDRSRADRLCEIQTVFQTSISYGDAACQAGASAEVVEVQAAAHAWLGLSFRCSRNYSSALESYQRATGIWRLLLVFSRNRAQQISYQRSLAAALFGTAKTLRLLGKDEEAARCRAESHTLFQKSRASSLNS